MSLASCQDTSESNDLKDRISNIEIKIDSLQNQIQKLSEPKSLPVTKKKTALNKKKETNSDSQFLIKEPDQQPIEKITAEQKQDIPVKATNYSYSSESHQCMGTTKRGARCKRMVRGGNYCWQHGG